MKVAIVYDRVNKWGGAERVLLALHELFPDAPLYTSVYDEEGAFWAKSFNVKTSFLQKITVARKSHEFFAALMPIAFESFSFDEYDLVISVTSEFAKSIITKPGTAHICICLTPTRYLWSGYDEYFANPLLRVAAFPVVRFLRKVDRITAYRPDAYIAISEEVKRRIKTYYGQDAEVIYPPVDIPKGSLSTKEGAYFLVVSRLVKYKRVDLAIQAANKLGVSLKIVGVGRERKRLEQMAGKTVTFLGQVSEEELADLYRNAKALIFPGKEDFGIVMVEAQSYGKPVAAFGQGASTEIIIPGKTGELFSEQSVDSLIRVLEKISKSKYNRESCIENAKRFSKEHFKKEIQLFIDKRVRASKV